MYNDVEEMTENQLRETIRRYEESAKKGELTSRDASRLRELKIALKNINSAISNRWF